MLDYMKTLPGEEIDMFLEAIDEMQYRLVLDAREIFIGVVHGIPSCEKNDPNDMIWVAADINEYYGRNFEKDGKKIV